MATAPKRGRLPFAAACLATVFAAPGTLRAQSPTLSITLTGQSMIRSDIRVHAPSAVPIITSLLKGDVVFTNFEATIIDEKKGQSRKDGRFLSPPEALEALKMFGVCARLEGILPALETAHAVVEAMRIAAKRAMDDVVLVCFSGRGDKDCFEVARLQGEEI